MEKNLLSIAFWVLLLGGLFGVIAGTYSYFTDGTPTEYGVMGIGGGAFLAWSALVAFLRSKLS